MPNRKKAVSIRMSASDVAKIKRLAKRLGVRDSDVIRYAVRSALSKLGPLHDLAVRGRSLVPVFVESGTELFQFFDLDATRLETIINDEAEDGRRVDHEDIQLIAMSGVQKPFVRWHLARSPVPTSGDHNPASGVNGRTFNGAAPDRSAVDDVEVTPTLREYLYEKYVYRNRGEA
jgi:Arc/MetJ-type ribon-helix-helix transcriptional regulator